MIQRTPVRIEAQLLDNSVASWQKILADSITSPELLLTRVGLKPEKWLKGASLGHNLFSIRVPAPYLNRIRKGDPYDPLLRQVLPLSDEGLVIEGFVTDPLEEADSTAATGLIRKYRSRALLMITGQCAINCRYCFRRHFPYDEHRLSPQERTAALTKLRLAPEINEVIFSGGDPLAANDKLLARWVKSLAEIPHIKRIRIHTRLPIVIPQRVTDDMLSWLSHPRLKFIMVLHINHAAELDDLTRAALAKLSTAGVTLLNQSVILKGVNDDTQTLYELSEALFDAGVLPYYLHTFDPVQGAHHFNVEDERARQLMRELNALLPGFLVPRLVREIPGKTGKTPLDLHF